MADMMDTENVNSLGHSVSSACVELEIAIEEFLEITEDQDNIPFQGILLECNGRRFALLEIDDDVLTPNRQTTVRSLISYYKLSDLYVGVDAKALEMPNVFIVDPSTNRLSQIETVSQPQEE